MKRAEDTVKVAKLLYDKYIKEYGNILCLDLQAQLYGSHYYPMDPDDLAKLFKAGAYSSSKKSACHIVGNAAQ